MNYQNTETKKVIKRLQTMVTKADNRLAFGDELPELVESQQLELLLLSQKVYDTIYNGKHKISSINKNKFYIISDLIIDQYGGAIGIKYY